MKTPRIERILVPIDFSEMTEAVIEHACYLGRQLGSRLTLMHVVHVPPLAEASTWLDPVISPSIEQDIRKQMKEKSTSRMTEIAESCKAEGVETDTVIKIGIPFDEIIKAIGDRDIDLVVMGTHGRTGLSHIIIGSVAERVVRRAPCSVFCINPKVLEEEGAE